MCYVHLPTTEVLWSILDTFGPGRLCLLGEESFDFSWINEAPNADDDDAVDGGFIWRLATNDVVDWGPVWVVFRLLNSVPDWFGTIGALDGVSIMVLFFDNAWGAGLLINWKKREKTREITLMTIMLGISDQTLRLMPSFLGRMQTHQAVLWPLCKFLSPWFHLVFLSFAFSACLKPIHYSWFFGDTTK